MGDRANEAWTTRYLDSVCCRGYSPATIHCIRQSLNCFGGFLEAKAIPCITQIGAADGCAYRHYLVVERRFAPGTVWMRLLAARRFLSFLADQGAVAASLPKSIDLPPLPPALPRLVLSRKQARTILATPNLATAMGIRDSAILEVFYSTGLRRAELALLKTSDVHLADDVIHVRHAKFNRDRLVPLGTIARERLREYIEQVRPTWLKSEENLPDLWLSAIDPHQPIHAPAVASIVNRVAKAAGIRAPVSPHVWRHTCATHLVRRGAPLPCVQRLLGHRSLNTTQLYARVAVTDLQRTFVRTHPRAQERNPHVPTPVFDH